MDIIISRLGSYAVESDMHRVIVSTASNHQRYLFAVYNVYHTLCVLVSKAYRLSRRVSSLLALSTDTGIDWYSATVLGFYFAAYL